MYAMRSSLTEKTAEESNVKGVWDLHSSTAIRARYRPVETTWFKNVQDSTALPDFACIVDKRRVYHHIAFDNN